MRRCGAPGYAKCTVTLPLLRPGNVAAWLLIFIASVRELGFDLPMGRIQGDRAGYREFLAQLEFNCRGDGADQTATVFITVPIMFVWHAGNGTQ
jgi:iron(III) transport system permease protein